MPPTPAPTALKSTAAAAPSFRQLYQQHFGFTWRSLRYLGVRAAQLDDAVQEVWVAVHRRLGDFEGRSDVKTWLFGIALNVQRNLHRSERRHSQQVPLPSDLIAPSGDPLLEREGREAWNMVMTYLDTLDELPRTVFVASLLEGLSPRETAHVSGLDVPAVYLRVRSLRRSFRSWAAARRGEP